MAYFTPRISITQNLPLGQIVPIGSVAGTVTGSLGYGSSLFLQRLFIPGQLNITEFDQALGMAFPATNQGAGSVSKTLAIYSFGNSTSLASVASISGSSTWTTGTSTVAGSTSLTQFQGGWAGSIIQAMTFASTQIEPGDYVVGVLFNFAQLSSTWSVSLFGQSAESVSSAGAGLLSSAGLAAASALTASSSSAITAFSAALTAANVLSSSGLATVSAMTATATGSALSTAGVSGSGLAVAVASLTSIRMSFGASSAAASSTTIFSSAGSITFSNSAGSVQPIISATVTGSLLTSTGSMPVFSSGGLSAGSFFGSSGSAAVISNSVTAGYSLLASGGLSAGSFHTGSTSTLGVTGVSLGALPNFTYIGTGSTTSAFPSAFIAGIMSTGAVPASIALSTTALTMWGSAPLAQPWFALIGA